MQLCSLLGTQFHIHILLLYRNITVHKEGVIGNYQFGPVFFCEGLDCCSGFVCGFVVWVFGFFISTYPTVFPSATSSNRNNIKISSTFF